MNLRNLIVGSVEKFGIIQIRLLFKMFNVLLKTYQYNIQSNFL